MNVQADCQMQPGSSRREVCQEVNRLFAVYRQHTGREPMVGGVQNLILRRDGATNHWLSRARADALFDFAGSTFAQLPVDLKLRVFSYLPPSQLCIAGQVCVDWLLLSSADYLWRPILRRRSLLSTQIFDDRNPDFFKRVCPEMAAKQVYLKCQPRCAPTSFRIPRLLNMLVPSKPRLVMFGPGLETRTSRLVRSILTDQHLKDLNRADRFCVTGMVPGEFAGVGSGISLKFGYHHFNLITLYSNVKSVRQGLSAENRVSHNKLFTHESRAAGAAAMYQVAPAVQELCRRGDGFVFVVDATRSAADVAQSQPELFAVLCELWAASPAPLLVLSCARADAAAAAMSPLAVVRALRLGRLKRKWLTQSADVDNLRGVREGFAWLLSQTTNSTLFG